LGTLVSKVIGTCTACARVDLLFPSLGVVLYGALALVSCRSQAGAFLVYPLTAALAVHAVLVLEMFQVGVWCVLCLATALGGLLATLLTLAIHPKGLIGLLLLAPVSLGLAYALLAPSAWLFAHERPLRGTVRLYVYERAGCPSCGYFKETILPGLRSRSPVAIDVTFVDWNRLPPRMDGLPVIVIAGAGSTEVARAPLDEEELRKQVQSMDGVPLGPGERR
jgi:hypothetical protein